MEIKEITKTELFKLLGIKDTKSPVAVPPAT